VSSWKRSAESKQMTPCGTRLARLRNILAKYKVASSRTLEQKIADAGPQNQRIDPHILTEARRQLEAEEIIVPEAGTLTTISWYHLRGTPKAVVQARLRELEPIYQSTTYGAFVTRAGQALEIAVFRALQAQQNLSFLGHFKDLDQHEDDTMYSKEEPPSALSGRQIQSGKLDFLLVHPIAGWAGIAAKNIREWLYPNRQEVMDLLAKCCDLQVIPVLVARRIAYATFSLLHPVRCSCSPNLQPIVSISRSRTC